MTETSLAKTEPRGLANRNGEGQSFQSMIAREQGGAIAGFTEKNQFRIRFPRLGKIHLGVKREAQNGKEYPVATDYFVLPEKLLNDKGFRKVLEDMGQNPDKPKVLPVWLPSPNFWENVQSSYDCYSKTHGLLCRSFDGVTCRKANGDGTYSEGECKNELCPKVQAKECAMMHRLRVFLPDAEGVGVWQIDFKGKNSWGAIESEMGTIKSTARGQIAGLDLKLSLEPEERLAMMFNKATGQNEQRNTIIYVMHLNTAITLRDMQDAIKEAAGRVNWDIAEVEDVSTEYDEAAEADECAEVPADTQEVIDQETGEVTQVPVEAEVVEPAPDDTAAPPAEEEDPIDGQLRMMHKLIGAKEFSKVLDKFGLKGLKGASADKKLAVYDACRLTINGDSQ